MAVPPGGTLLKGKNPRIRNGAPVLKLKIPDKTSAPDAAVFSTRILALTKPPDAIVPRFNSHESAPVCDNVPPPSSKKAGIAGGFGCRVNVSLANISAEDDAPSV